MDDLKFSVLSRIHQATRLSPIRRTELLSGAQDVPGTSRAIKELISSGFVREELGSDALYIQPPGTAALEAEIERRSMLMWLIPGEKAISLLRKGYELLSQGLRLLLQG